MKFATLVKAFVLASIFIAVTGCNYPGRPAVNADPSQPARIAGWLVYWELDAGVKDLEKLGGRLEKLAYFAAYFDENDRLFVPKELADTRSRLQKKKDRPKAYLTFVNDRRNADGSVAMKDGEVLRRVFADDAAMEKHIDEVIALAVQGGYDGIELDYEKIWADEQLGQSFLRFAGRLFLKAQKKDLKLRIVLEPNAPFANPAFFKGPEYVVMFYNLYGLHSGPGPKANKDFIARTLARMAALPGEKAAAFATGGCLWSDSGKKSLLTEVEAKMLAAIYDVEGKRDQDSQCVVFDYRDINGVTYRVWYADVKTLNYWIALAKEQGETGVSIWRLGGNVDVDKLR